MLVEDAAAPRPPGGAVALPPAPARTRAQVLAAAVATGVLGTLAFPPFDVGWLALVAPAPLLWAWRGMGPGRAARAGGLAGFAFYAGTLWWLNSLSPIAMPIVAAVLAGWWALAGAAITALARRGFGGPFWAAAVWLAMESLRGRWPLGGFTWAEWGYAFHDIPVVRALAPFGGVRLVTAVAVLVAGALVEIVEAARDRGGDVRAVPRRAVAAVAVAALAMAAAGTVGPRTRPTGTVRIAAVQGNDLNRDLTREERAANYLPQSHFRLAAGITGPVDLVIFPESSMDATAANADAIRAGIRAVIDRLGTAVLANDSSVPLPDGRRQNLNVYYDVTGTLVGTYAKRHLVPFGEYIPFRSLLGGLSVLERVGRDTRPGPGRVVWEVDGVRFGTMICFESAFSEDARAYARDGAEILIVTTNNRSYERTANSRQHVAMSQMRAAETGRPLVHAAISGVTAFIDADGDVVASTDLFEPTVVERAVTGTAGRTPYVVLGEWVVALAWVALAAASARVAVVTRRTRRAGRLHDAPDTWA